MSLPIHFGVRHGWDIVSFRAQGGIVLTKALGGKTSFNDIISDYKQAFKGLESRLGKLGVGVDVWKITVDVRYEGDFSKYANHMEFFGNDIKFSARERQLKVSVGYKF